MNEELIKKAVVEFSKSAMSEYRRSFTVSGNDKEIFTVKIERGRLSIAGESMAEARNNTISALPSGSQCSCCGGSGRSSS